MGLSFQPCVTARELCSAQPAGWRREHQQSGGAAVRHSRDAHAHSTETRRTCRHAQLGVTASAAGAHCAETAASAVTIPWRRSGLAYPWLACWLSSVEIESVTPPQHQQHCPLHASRAIYSSLLPLPPSPSLHRTAPSPPPPALTAAFARTCPLSPNPHIGPE